MSTPWINKVTLPYLTFIPYLTIPYLTLITLPYLNLLCRMYCTVPYQFSLMKISSNVISNIIQSTHAEISVNTVPILTQFHNNCCLIIM